MQALPCELVATAWTKDVVEPEARILMGVAHKSKPIFGVQWHPESICSSHGLKIMNNFRKVVHDFWTSNSERTQRSIGRHRSEITFATSVSSIGIHMNDHLHVSSTLVETSITHKAFSVKTVNLGDGPSPETVFEYLIHNPLNDGEAWLDSAKVS